MAGTGKKSQVLLKFACLGTIHPHAPQATCAGQSLLGQYQQPWKSNMIMAQVTKIIWEAKKIPFFSVDLHDAHSLVTAATTLRGPLRASLLELQGRRVAQSYFPRQNTELSVRGRERALLSSSKDPMAALRTRECAISTALDVAAE